MNMEICDICAYGKFEALSFFFCAYFYLFLTVASALD